MKTSTFGVGSPKTSWILGAATLAFLGLNLLPFGGIALYPVKLFVTYIHEFCHALAALLTGGHVYSISIHPDESGETLTSGGVLWVICSAGYVGTVLVGLACFRFLRSGLPVRALLFVFLLILLGSVYYTGFHSLFGTGLGLLMIGGLSWGIWKSSLRTAELLAAFLSIQLIVGAFYDLKILLLLSGTSTHTDALNMQHNTGIPALFWAIVWLAFASFAAYRTIRSFFSRLPAEPLAPLSTHP